MQEFPHWQRAGTRETVLRTLTAPEAADAGRWYSQQGDYRSAAVWHQLAGALEYADRPTTDTTIADRIRAASRNPVPLPPRWSEVVANDAAWAPGAGPTGNGDVDLADTAVMRPARADDTAQIPLPESHAPTTCVYAWDISTYGEPDREMVCGELIRWSEPNGWYHVNDKPLSKPSDHTATPQGLGPLPRRQGPLA